MLRLLKPGFRLYFLAAIAVPATPHPHPRPPIQRIRCKGGQHMQVEEGIGVGSRWNNIILLIYIEGSNK